MSNLKCPSCDHKATLSKAPEDLNLNDVKEKGYVFFCIEESCKGKMEFRLKVEAGEVDKILSTYKRVKSENK